MKIYTNVYEKRNGDLMIYVNGSNKVSLGISDRLYRTKLTNGQRNVLSAFFKCLNTIEPIYTGELNFDNHTEKKAFLDQKEYALFITDIANIAGLKVEEDGAYLYELRSKKLFKLSDLTGEF